MSKAVLIMDMPDSCMGCNFLYCDAENNTESCQAIEKERIVDLEKEDKPDWCPLRPMPEKVTEDGLECYGELKYMQGWNDCRNVIMGDIN